MDKKEMENLKAAHDAVFDENGQIKNCGREVCINLINLMRTYTTKDVGNENTGKIEVPTMQAEYHKLIG